ncbi:MAG TPA: Uma2 family endonuclease [Thermoanaerobaculia bacterium]|jgi:Uma2 family endonuclease
MAVLKDSREILMSGEELFLRPDLEPCELVNGRIVPLSPTGGIHGRAEARLTTRLSTFVESSQRGEVLTGEVGIYIRRDPDTVRAADVVFISKERWARYRPEGYLNVAPEIVVEVLSPGDRRGELAEKLQDYFSAGVDRVWVLDSKQRRISAYRSLTDVQHFQVGDILTDEELLPGFSLAIADLFG